MRRDGWDETQQLERQDEISRMRRERERDRVRITIGFCLRERQHEENRKMTG